MITALTSAVGSPSANWPIAPVDAASLVVLTDAVRRELPRTRGTASTAASQQNTTELTKNSTTAGTLKPAGAAATQSATPVTAAAVPATAVPTVASAVTSTMTSVAAAIAKILALRTKMSAAPVANSDSFTGTENTAVTGNVLSNDTDPLGRTLSAHLVTAAKDGTLKLNANGSFTYTPKSGFTGTDTFSYVASDGLKKSTVTAVRVSISAPTTTPASNKPIVGVQGISSWVGLSQAQINQALALAKAAGATSVRIDISWWAVEYTQGTDDWSQIDPVVKDIQNAGMTPLAMIYDTPTWLSGSTNPHTPPANTTQEQLFGQFAATVAEHYAGQIQNYEIWNEENIPAFWSSPNAASYTATLKAAYTAIKAVDPTDVVLAGGLSPDASGIDPTTFIQEIYAAGGKGYFDALAYHQYSFPNLPTIAPIQAIHNVMVANGDGSKQIWLTEAGAPTGTGSYAVSDEVQAETVSALLEEAQQYSYIGPVYFYTIMDTGADLSDPEDNFGLITQNGTPKLAYDVLKQFMTGGSSAINASASA